jgi:hypothetical protein
MTRSVCMRRSSAINSGSDVKSWVEVEEVWAVRGGGGEGPVRSPGSSQVDEDKTDTTCNMRACSHTRVTQNSSVLRLTSSTHALPGSGYSDQTCPN